MPVHIVHIVRLVVSVVHNFSVHLYSCCWAQPRHRMCLYPMSPDHLHLSVSLECELFYVTCTHTHMQCHLLSCVQFLCPCTLAHRSIWWGAKGAMHCHWMYSVHICCVCMRGPVLCICRRVHATCWTALVPGPTNVTLMVLVPRSYPFPSNLLLPIDFEGPPFFHLFSCCCWTFCPRVWPCYVCPRPHCACRWHQTDIYYIPPTSVPWSACRPNHSYLPLLCYFFHVVSLFRGQHTPFKTFLNLFAKV